MFLDESINVHQCVDKLISIVRIVPLGNKVRSKRIGLIGPCIHLEIVRLMERLKFRGNVWKIDWRIFHSMQIRYTLL